MSSRQRRWAIRQTKKGRCAICGAPRVTSQYCAYHRDMHKAHALKSYYKKIKEVMINSCPHKHTMPDFESWELECCACGKRRDMESEEGEKHFAQMMELNQVQWW